LKRPEKSRILTGEFHPFKIAIVPFEQIFSENTHESTKDNDTHDYDFFITGLCSIRH
jgi:hypothetical protein